MKWLKRIICQIKGHDWKPRNWSTSLVTPGRIHYVHLIGCDCNRCGTFQYLENKFFRKESK